MTSHAHTTWLRWWRHGQAKRVSDRAGQRTAEISAGRCGGGQGRDRGQGLHQGQRLVNFFVNEYKWRPGVNTVCTCLYVYSFSVDHCIGICVCVIYLMHVMCVIRCVPRVCHMCHVCHVCHTCHQVCTYHSQKHKGCENLPSLHVWWVRRQKILRKSCYIFRKNGFVT